MRAEKLTHQWYQLTHPRSGYRAGYRGGSGFWSVYFRKPDGSPAFGQRPGEEVHVDTRSEAVRVARASLEAGRIVR